MHVPAPFHRRATRAACALGAALIFAGALSSVPATADTVPTAETTVSRTALTAAELTSGIATAAVPSSAFAAPTDAAPPVHELEGTLTLQGPALSGGFIALKDPYGYGTLDAVKRLPDVSIELVQNDGVVIPAARGLRITDSTAWNMAIGLGRAWQEEGDGGMTRAALPFSLIERNANCVHNGLMTFLFSDTSVSQLRYQITSETCEYFQFDLWGQQAVTLTHGQVADASGIRSRAAEELADRLPTRPITQLASDHPGSGIDVSAFGSGITPSALSGYGFVYEGINYVGTCPTRQGDHPYCSEVLLPSYSTAKSAFGTLALLHLAQKYSPAIAEELIQDHVPEAAGDAAWNGVTIRNALDMATGNYNSAGYEVDEAGAVMNDFFLAEDYSGKTTAALSFPRKSAPGTQWVYHTSDTYLAVQAMDSVLEGYEGADADIFEMLRDEVLIPAGVGPDALSTLRTENSPTGAPFGGYGMFWTTDAIAKVAELFGPLGGAVDGEQLLHPGLLDAAMQRDVSDRGLDVPGESSLHYNMSVWAKDFSSADDPSFVEAFTVPFMSGFGGITVALMPNGSTYYVFSDGNEFVWNPAVTQSHRLASMTSDPEPDPDPDPDPDPTPDECSAGGVVGNGDFETGAAAPWSATSTVIDSRSYLEPARNGSWKAWLNGFGWANTDTLSQTFTVPTECADATLTFWLRVTTAERRAVAYDSLALTVVDDTGASIAEREWSNLDAQDYSAVAVPLTGIAGQTVTITFTGSEDYSLQTSFVIDDVTLE
ncbi:hypothetical protein ACTU6U_10200 [Microbacterium sp. A196]|uniref:hypothetical protein n=1 Tax=Microbacterium sp. A196 TaxID=3457320 RepID=UPI003FD5E86F